MFLEFKGKQVQGSMKNTFKMHKLFTVTNYIILKNTMKKDLKKIILILGLPITYFSALWLRFISNGQRLQSNERIFSILGILPVLDHYYQPLINPKKHLKKSLRSDRHLKGIDWNIEKQLSIFQSISLYGRIKKVSSGKTERHRILL